MPVLAVAGWWHRALPGALAAAVPGVHRRQRSRWARLVGVDRAALGLAVAWSAGVVVPSLADRRPPGGPRRRQLARCGRCSTVASCRLVVLVRARRRRRAAAAPEPSCTDDDIEPLTNGEIMMRAVSAAETAPTTYRVGGARREAAGPGRPAPGRQRARPGARHRRARPARPERRRQDHADARPGHGGEAGRRPADPARRRRHRQRRPAPGTPRPGLPAAALRLLPAVHRPGVRRVHGLAQGDAEGGHPGRGAAGHRTGGPGRPRRLADEDAVRRHAAPGRHRPGDRQRPGRCCCSTSRPSASTRSSASTSASCCARSAWTAACWSPPTWSRTSRWPAPTWCWSTRAGWCGRAPPAQLAAQGGAGDAGDSATERGYSALLRAYRGQVSA